MRFIDWFAGIGGFRRGMELAGHECVGFCEFDKYAVMSYTAMHLCTQEQLVYLATLPLKQRQKEILKDEYKNGEWYANDVRRVDAGDIPEADCWCFGFPCQDISVAGKQAGFNGTRSSLFFEVMRLLDERKANGFSCPGYLFIENVKNLLSINRGIDFAKVLFALDERGYDAEWQVLNSKNFGVPQNRERVFIIGHLRSGCTAEVFPVEGADGENNIRRIGHAANFRRYRQVFDRGGITESIDTCQGGGREPHTIEVIGTLDSKRHSQMNVVGSCGVHPTLTTLKEYPKVGLSLSEIGEGCDADSTCPVCAESQKTFKHKPADDISSDVFAIDKGIQSKERTEANCITAREDRGLSRHQQEGTLICHKIR